MGSEMGLGLQGLAASVFQPIRVCSQMVLMLAALLLVTGCGKTERLVDKAIQEKTLYITAGSDVTTLDPHLVQSSPDSTVVGAIFEGLVIPDSRTLESRPAIATHWEVDSAGLEYRFYLRRDAQFSDGVAINAHTFVGSIKRALSPNFGAPYTHFLFFLKGAEAYNKGTGDFADVGVKALDDYTLVFTLDHPVSYFLSVLQYPIYYPVPLHLLAQMGTPDTRNYRWTKPDVIVSNGAFTLKSIRPNANTIVDKNPRYWDADNVRLDRIVFNSTANIMIDERMFKGGLVHKTFSIPAIKNKDYIATRPPYFHHGSMYATFYLMFNVDRGPLSDVRVRQALGLAIDRKAITESVLRGGQLVAKGLVAPDDTGFTSIANAQYDPEQARKLLREAGFEGGKGLPKMSLLYNISDDREKIATAIQQMWKKNLGISVELKSQEWKVFLDTQDKENYDISVRAWRGDYIHSNTFLEIFTSASENNGTGWQDAHYDSLIQKAYGETDLAQQLRILEQAEKYLIDAAPITPIYHFTRGYLLDSRVRGLDFNVADEIVFKQVHFVEE